MSSIKEVLSALHDLAGDGITSESQREWRQEQAGIVYRFITEHCLHEWQRKREGRSCIHCGTIEQADIERDEIAQAHASAIERHLINEAKEYERVVLSDGSGTMGKLK